MASSQPPSIPPTHQFPSVPHIQSPAQHNEYRSRPPISYSNPPDPQRAQSRSPISQPSQAPTKAPRAKELTRDQKVEVIALHKYAKMNATKIAEATGYTYRQVRYVLETPLELESRKSNPRPRGRRVSGELLQVLKDFLDEDESNKEIAWGDLRFLVPGFLDIGPDAISTAMQTLGYSRRRPRTRAD